MTRFRPCIDLHAGQVKQIVGGTLTTENANLKTNFVSTHNAAYYARLYRDAAALGAHVIMLGPGNEDAAREAVEAWSNRLQVGGGINDTNAKQWVDAGAEKVGHHVHPTFVLMGQNSRSSSHLSYFPMVNSLFNDSRQCSQP